MTQAASELRPGLSVQLDPPPTAMVWLAPGKQHEAIAVPTVVLAPGDALVEIELATICGSDVHTTLGHRTVPAPLVLGHEQVGQVVALGTGAITAAGSPLALGDRVVWSVTVGCGSCAACGRGLPQKCSTVRKYGHEQLERGWELSGGFATHVHLRAGTAVVPVDRALDATVLAPVSCGTATAAAALDAAAAVTPIAGEAVVVFGAGLIGLTICAMATDRGARVVVVDPESSRRALASRFGAVATADPVLDPEVAGSLARALATFDEQPAVAVDASGSPAAVASAIGAVRIGGVCILVGSVFPTDAVPLDPERVVRRLLTLRGVHNYAPRHLIEAARFVEARHTVYPLHELVGATVALSDLDAGIAAAAHGRAVRIAVAPD
ncbi:zinc-binding dehydrogenase [Cryobacterium sp. SO1]|uniref:zinc-binding dehydrogenase n=1 Tax=Cryobacterium sp. SO1 TaxID=1897061 RepID=UPI001022A181|nr:zinc-binding dehydrogenase [Cryobacterium sp. SO1]RZI34823.1 L-threonine 3-dehydrogenase [Cryobacterium sp. SO1]